MLAIFQKCVIVGAMACAMALVCYHSQASSSAGSAELLSTAELVWRVGGACPDRGCVTEACNPGGCPAVGSCSPVGGSCVGLSQSSGEKCGDKPGWRNCSETSDGQCGTIKVGAPVDGQCPVFALSIVLVMAEVPRSPVTIEEVVLAMEEHERVFQGYEVTCHFESRLRAFPFESNEYRLRSSTVKYAVDREGRVRTESVSEIKDGDSTEFTSATAVFDGNVSTSVHEQRGIASGRITPHSYDVYGNNIDPRNFITRVRNREAVPLLRERNARIAGQQEWEGQMVVVVETEPLSNIGMQWMTRLLVAPDLNFAIVRAADYFRYSEGQEWTEFVRTEMFEHAQDASGLWLPKRILHEEYSAPSDPAEEPFLLKRLEISAKGWRVNPDVPEEAFAVEFPAGTLVDDEVNRTTFKVAQITDQMVAVHATGIKPLSNRSNARWWLIWGHVVVVAAVIVIVLFMRRVRS